MENRTSFCKSKITERSFIRAKDGVKIAFVQKGSGEPVVFIPGLGRGADMWERQMEELSQNFLVLAIENRGSGESDKPEGPYSIEMMADDVASLLEAQRIPSASIVGASMGGFVAQEFALKYPEMVRRLVLVSTSAGGPQAVPMDQDTWKKMEATVGMNPQKGLLKGVELAFSGKYFERNYDSIVTDVKRRLENLPPQHCWFAQAGAGAQHNAWDRLSDLQIPTLIMTGLQDIIVPPINSQFLKDLIKDSQLIEIEEAGHYVNIEVSERFNREVASFLMN